MHTSNVIIIPLKRYNYYIFSQHNIPVHASTERLTNDLRTIETFVTYEETLEFSTEVGAYAILAYISSLINWFCSDKWEAAHYKLRGFIKHHGTSVTSGHYTAAYVTTENQWYCLDDEKVWLNNYHLSITEKLF